MMKVCNAMQVINKMYEKKSKGWMRNLIMRNINEWRTSKSMWKILFKANMGILQRQTVVSQFFQLDRLVVEGQKTVRRYLTLNLSRGGTDFSFFTLQGKQIGNNGDIVRQTSE